MTLEVKIKFALIIIILMWLAFLPACMGASDVKVFERVVRLREPMFPIRSCSELKEAMSSYSAYGYCKADLTGAVGILEDLVGKKSDLFLSSLGSALNERNGKCYCPDIVVKLLIVFCYHRYVMGFDLDTVVQIFIERWFSKGNEARISDFIFNMRSGASEMSYPSISSVKDMRKGGGFASYECFLEDGHTMTDRFRDMPTRCCVLL